MRFSLIIISLLWTFQLVQAQQQNCLPEWIVGTWKLEYESNISYEKWQNSGDTLLIGKTYTLYQTDTVFFDEMFIKCIDQKPVYFMFGTKQNNRVFAAYSLDENSDDNILIFKNNEIDFPNEFAYEIIDPKIISVWFKSNLDLETCVDFKMIKISD